jgi:CHAT domain-containing protein
MGRKQAFRGALLAALLALPFIARNACADATLASVPGASSSDPACSPADPSQIFVTCRLAALYRLSNDAALNPARSDDYVRAATGLRAKILSMKDLTPALLENARLAISWAIDPDNPASNARAHQDDNTGNVLRQAYAQVCMSESGQSLPDSSPSAACAVSRIRLSALDAQRNPPGDPSKDVEAVTALKKTLAEHLSSGHFEPQELLLVRRVVLMGYGFAAAARVTSNLQLATRLASAGLSAGATQIAGASSDMDGIAFVVSVCGYVGSSVTPPQAPSPPIVLLLQRARQLAIANFPRNHDVPIEAEESLVMADSSIALYGDYDAQYRGDAAKEAKQLNRELYQFALALKDPATQDKRLETVQRNFQWLDERDLFMEVASRRYAMALNSQNGRPQAIRTATSIAAQLSSDPQQQKQATAWAAQLLPEIQALPDSTEGIASILFNEVDALLPGVAGMSACDRKARLALLKGLNSRGRTLAQHDPIHAGMLSAPFDAQLVMLDTAPAGTGVDNAGAGACSVASGAASAPARTTPPPPPLASAPALASLSNAGSEEDDDLARQVQEALNNLSNSSDPAAVDVLRSLFDRVNIERDGIADQTPFVSPRTARLNRLQDKLLESGEHVAERGNQLAGWSWTNFRLTQARRLYTQGKVEEALAYLDKTQQYLSGMPQARAGNVAMTLATYPRVFREEATPPEWPATVYGNLISAMAKLNDTSGARALLGHLSGDQRRFSENDILQGMTNRAPVQDELNWIATLPDSEVSSWRASRMRAELDATATDDVEKWLVAGPQQDPLRRLRAIDKLIDAKQYDRAVVIARASDDARVRSEAAIRLADANALRWAEKLEDVNISPAAQIAVAIAEAHAQPAKQADILRSAAGRIPDSGQPQERIALARDVLCAAETETAKAFAIGMAKDYVTLIQTETNPRLADRERQQIGDCLVKLGAYDQGVALIDQSTDKRTQIAALETTALGLRLDWNDPDHAKAMLANAYDVFVSQPQLSQWSQASDLFEDAARIEGLEQGYERAKKLLPPESTAVPALARRERDVFAAAVGGLAKAAWEMEGARTVMELIEQARKDAGDAVAKTVAMDALNRAAWLNQNRRPVDTAALVEFTDTVALDKTSASNTLPYLMTLAKLWQFDHALSIVGQLSAPDTRAYAYAALAQMASRSATKTSPTASEIASLALSEAEKIPWRGKRINELSWVATYTAEIPGSDTARRAIDDATASMTASSVVDRRISDSFSKVRQIALTNRSASLSDSDSFQIVSALETFGTFYRAQGDHAQAEDTVALLKSFRSNESVADDARRATAAVGPGTPVEQFLLPMIADWKRRSAQDPDSVVKEMESDSSDYRDATLPVGIEAYELGFALSIQQLSRLDRQSNMAAQAAPDGAPLASQILADKLLELYARQQKLAGRDQNDIGRRAFEVMAIAQRSAAATALMRAMSRQRLGPDGGAARLADVAALNWRQSREQLVRALVSTRDAAQIKASLDVISASRTAFDSNQKAALDRTSVYLTTLRSATNKLPQIAGMLKADEALLVYRMSESELYLSVVTSRESRFFHLNSPTVNSVSVTQWVNMYRATLDPSSNGNNASPPPDMNYGSANLLYKAVIEPAEPILANVKHLIVVPDGALSSIPFQILLTAPFRGDPSNRDDVKAANWMVKRYSISVAPSVTTLLLPAPRPTTQTTGLIAFGDPALGDWSPHGCSGPRAVLSDRATPARSASQPASEAAAALSSSPLPDTGCLLRDMARDLKARPEDLFVGPQATEGRVKQLSADGTLARHRVVAFATHAVMADQSEYHEPGLLFSPPTVPSKFDDGYLSASEVATLSLNADLVVLSACSTAVGAGPHGAGEAFGGLASSFLFAGARHLYVSHWEVDSLAGSMIFSAVFKEMASGERTGRDYADVLRTAELEILRNANSLREANPNFWAPFSALGP